MNHLRLLPHDWYLKFFFPLECLERQRTWIHIGCVFLWDFIFQFSICEIFLLLEEIIEKWRNWMSQPFRKRAVLMKVSGTNNNDAQANSNTVVCLLIYCYTQRCNSQLSMLLLCLRTLAFSISSFLYLPAVCFYSILSYKKQKCVTRRCSLFTNPLFSIQKIQFKS